MLNLRLITPEVAAFLLDLPSPMFIPSLPTVVTVSFILSTNTGLLKIVCFRDSHLSNSNLTVLFLNSSIPTLQIDLDGLSSSIITSFNCNCKRLNFCNFILMCSIRLIWYSFFQRYQKWFRTYRFFWSEHLNWLVYIFQIDRVWKVLVFYHIRMIRCQAFLAVIFAIVCQQPVAWNWLDFKQNFCISSKLNYHLVKPFSTKLSWCRPTSRKTHCVSMLKASSPSNLHLNYAQEFESDSKQHSFRHQTWRYLDNHV